jgi:hypothetical protein
MNRKEFPLLQTKITSNHNKNFIDRCYMNDDCHMVKHGVHKLNSLMLAKIKVEKKIIAEINIEKKFSNLMLNNSCSINSTCCTSKKDFVKNKINFFGNLI